MLNQLDKFLIQFSKKFDLLFARAAIFIVFFWFGILKVFGFSPANALVANLLEKTLPFFQFEQFIIFFGVIEMIIGISFIIPRFERLAIALLVLHMLTTALPLFFLPDITWQQFLVPSLEGQYIIKNVALIALAVGIGSRLSINFKR